jgi:biopolymer transport protein ExbD
VKARRVCGVVGIVVALFSSGCLSPVIPIGSGKSARQAQHDTMSDMTPGRLVVDTKWSGEVTTKKVRVWADGAYRSQNVKWQQSFEEPLELANATLTPLFGLRLVAEYHVWDRHVAGTTLAEDIEALAERDSGDGAFAVIGLTSSLPLVSATFEELGIAAVGGRHVVLRGYADLHERKLYANAFPDLRTEERELALDARRRHKSAVLLLHELAHNLGAEHANEDETITSASYSHRAGAFTASVRAQLLRAVDQRVGRATQVDDAPATVDKRPAVHHAPVIVRVTSTGETVVDGKRLDAAALTALFTSTFAEDPDTQILIHSDRKVPVGAVGDVIDRAKAVGLTKFAFGRSGL